MERFPIILLVIGKTAYQRTVLTTSCTVRLLKCRVHPTVLGQYCTERGRFVRKDLA
jgi:hypothetical protein